MAQMIQKRHLLTLLHDTCDEKTMGIEYKEGRLTQRCEHADS